MWAVSTVERQGQMVTAGEKGPGRPHANLCDLKGATCTVPCPRGSMSLRRQAASGRPARSVLFNHCVPAGPC